MFCGRQQIPLEGQDELSVIIGSSETHQAENLPSLIEHELGFNSLATLACPFDLPYYRLCTDGVWQTEQTSSQ